MHIQPPKRASHTYTQHLVAAPERVFPLLCPVRECDWAVGWEPGLVLSRSGLAEADCVFTTPQSGREALWYITRHEAANGFVEMLKITPGVTACRLQIQLAPDGKGCTADVSYMHTSLGPDGDRLVDEFTAEYYVKFMQAWEREMNHYLETGRLLAQT